MNSKIRIEFEVESMLTIYPNHAEIAGWKLIRVDTGRKV